MQIQKLLLPAAAIAAFIPASAQSQQSPVSPQPEQKTWTKKQIRKTVRKILSESSSIPAEKIESQHFFDKDLGMDSLDAVEAIMNAEETFGITVPDEVAEKLVQVEMMEKYFIQMLKGR